MHPICGCMRAETTESLPGGELFLRYKASHSTPPDCASVVKGATQLHSRIELSKPRDVMSNDARGGAVSGR